MSIVEQVLERAGRKVEPYLDFVKLLEEIRKTTPDAQAIVQALLEYKNNPGGGGSVAVVVAALHLDGAKLQAFITGHEAELTLLAGSVEGLVGKPLSWTLDDKGTIAAGSVSIQLEGTAAATISGDDDGDLFDDGGVTYDKTKDAFLRFEVSGTVSSSANLPPLPIGALSGKGAFSAEAAVTAGTYFKHPLGTSAIDAIVADVPRFRLPYDTSPMPDGQYVRLNGSGSVAISGELSWGKTIVSTGEVSAQDLNLAASPVEADVQLGASVGFDAEVQGFFNIIVSSAGDGKLRAQLVKSRTTASGTTLQAGVGVTIKGIDKIAGSLLSQITTPLAPLVAILSKDLTELGDLHALFTKEVGDAADALLDKVNANAEIEKWLAVIGADASLKQSLKDILVNAVDDLAGPAVDKLNAAVTATVQPVVGFVKRLIGTYQKALAAMNKAVQAAAEVKIGIDLSRKQHKTDTSRIALSLVIDAQAQPEAYQALMRGDFTQALDLARAGHPDVKLEQATWSEKGSISIETSLSVAAFGRNVGAGSLLKQDWDWQLTAAGDLNLGVSTSLTAWAQGWRVLRSVTFLADTHVLAVVSSANQLLDPTVHDSVSIDVSQESTQFKRSDLSDWQLQMIALKVLSAPTTMLDDAVVDPKNTGAKFPYGDLVASASLTLTESQIAKIAATDSPTARRVFANALLDQYDGRDPFGMRDASGVPIAAWRSVQAWALGGRTSNEVPSSLAFTDDTGKKQNVNVRTFELNFLALMVKSFDAIISHLRDLGGKNSLASASVKDALRTIQKEQMRMFDAVKALLTADITSSREKVGLALFVTMWNLAGGPAEVDPIVILQRKADKKEDERRFVYA